MTTGSDPGRLGGRVLGVDHGERRIGLALGDPSGVLATPYDTIDANGGLATVARVCRETGATRIVVGLPLRLDAGEGPAAERARAFAEALRKRVAVPVELWDERFSTVTAEKALIEGGTRRARRRQLVDRLAAQILLQHYLDSRAARADPNAGTPP